MQNGKSPPSLKTHWGVSTNKATELIKHRLYYRHPMTQANLKTFIDIKNNMLTKAINTSSPDSLTSSPDSLTSRPQRRILLQGLFLGMHAFWRCFLLSLKCSSKQPTTCSCMVINSFWNVKAGFWHDIESFSSTRMVSGSFVPTLWPHRCVSGSY